MSVIETAGVTALARILVRLSDGSALTVAALSAEEGLARSTSFDIVGRMEAAQLLSRGPHGVLAPGSAAIDFGFSALGLAHFHGPMQAILIWLRDETDAIATLTTITGATEIELASIPAPWHKAGADLVDPLERRIATHRADVVLRLSLASRPGATRGERAVATSCFEHAAQSLAHYLKPPESTDDHRD